MEILKVRGNHRECGRQIGEHFRVQIKKEVLGIGKGDEAVPYWEATLSAYPMVAEEIIGVALGAEVEVIELFAYMIEEIWAEVAQEAKACSDIVLTAPLTDGRIIVGHNNDVSPETGRIMFPVEWFFDDGSSMFTVGPLGFYISAGANGSGIVLTGNEITQNDTKVGVPRSIIARGILTATNLDEAVKIATDSRRASSYNNIISTKERVVEIEGSATSYELVEPINGVLIHTNHYVCPTMLIFEGKPNYTSSIERLEQAEQMIQGKKGRVINAEDVEKMLAGHNGGSGDDNTVCRHGEKAVTVFGMVADFGEGVIRLAMGNPCVIKFEEIWRIPKRTTI